MKITLNSAPLTSQTEIKAPKPRISKSTTTAGLRTPKADYSSYTDSELEDLSSSILQQARKIFKMEEEDFRSSISRPLRQNTLQLPKTPVSASTRLPKLEEDSSSSLESRLRTLCKCIESSCKHWPSTNSRNKATPDLRQSQITAHIADIKQMNAEITLKKFNISEHTIWKLESAICTFDDPTSEYAIGRKLRVRNSKINNEKIKASQEYADLIANLHWTRWKKNEENFEVASHVCKGGYHEFEGIPMTSYGIPDCLKNIVRQYIGNNEDQSFYYSKGQLRQIKTMITKDPENGTKWLASWLKHPRLLEEPFNHLILTKEELTLLSQRTHLLKDVTFQPLRGPNKLYDKDIVGDYNNFLLCLLAEADAKDIQNPLKPPLNLVQQAFERSRNVFLSVGEDLLSKKKYDELIMRLRPQLSNLILHNRLLTLVMSVDDIGLTLLARCLEVPDSFDEDAESFTIDPSKIDRLLSLLSFRAVLDFKKARRLSLDILEKMNPTDKNNFLILANTVNAKVHCDVEMKQALKEIKANVHFWGTELFSLLLPQIRDHLEDLN